MILWVLAILLLTPRSTGNEQTTVTYSDQFLVQPWGVWKPPASSKERMKSLIIAQSQKYHIDPELALEIVRRESNFDPDVCNQKFGCGSGMGLFQI